MVGVSIWLGCLSVSRTVSFCFSFSHVARYAPSCLIDRIDLNVCARRAQRPSLLGLCRAAAKRLLETNYFHTYLSFKCLFIGTSISSFSDLFIAVMYITPQ